MPSYLIVEGMRVGLLRRLGEGVPGGGLPEAVYLRSSIDFFLYMAVSCPTWSLSFCGR